ncbi:MAG: PhzF family phenazine biosynthesis protein [Anaerolineae bacterium]|nr:PhzF family phenazine biosynthesis protein [Anaerolineae bacterium]
MQTLSYHLVDVFTNTPFGGNQLAVFLDPGNLSAQTMQMIARELNLSESAFVFPSDKADLRVRFFTPQVELPLAGHPTVGTAFVLQREGRIVSSGSATFEEGVGVIPITLGETIYMDQPVPILGSVWEDRHVIADMLSLSDDDLILDYPVQAVSSGVPFLYVPVRSLEAIKRIRFRQDLWANRLRDFEAPHVFAFTPETEQENATVHSRMFAPAMGINEDPATGAASGPLGAYLVTYGVVPVGEQVEIRSEQGYEIGRPSQISIRVECQSQQITRVQVGGSSVYMGAGHILLP